METEFVLWLHAQQERPSAIAAPLLSRRLGYGTRLRLGDGVEGARFASLINNRNSPPQITVQPKPVDEQQIGDISSYELMGMEPPRNRRKADSSCCAKYSGGRVPDPPPRRGPIASPPRLSRFASRWSGVELGGGVDGGKPTNSLCNRIPAALRC